MIFRLLAYSYSLSFFQRRIRPVLRKVRRNKVDIEWNNALFKAFIRRRFSVFSQRYPGYIMLATTLYWGTNTKGLFIYHGLADGKLGANLLDYKVEPFLRNAIGIPCPDGRKSVLQMISNLIICSLTIKTSLLKCEAQTQTLGWRQVQNADTTWRLVAQSKHTFMFAPI